MNQSKNNEIGVALSHYFRLFCREHNVITKVILRLLQESYNSVAVLIQSWLLNASYCYTLGVVFITNEVVLLYEPLKEK